MILLLILFIPYLYSDDYSIHILIMSGIFILLTMSFNISWGYTGLFVLCIPTFFALGGYISSLFNYIYNFPFLYAVVIALLIASISSIFIGYLTLRYKGPYFVIVTLIFNYVMRLIFNNLDITGGPIGMPNIPHPNIIIPNFIEIYISSNIEYYYYEFILIFLIMFFYYHFVNSRVGRILRSIRENEQFAEFVGVNTFKYKILALFLCSLLSGFAGILYAHYITQIDPSVFESYYMISPMAMTMLGGRGTFMGPIIAAVFLTILPEYLRLTKIYREVLYGSFLLILVILKPENSDIKSYILKIIKLVRGKMT